jgi:hypothetical protein
MFHSYRRLQKEKAKQRAINFDSNVIDRVFPAAKDDDIIELDLKYETDHGIELKTTPHQTSGEKLAFGRKLSSGQSLRFCRSRLPFRHGCGLWNKTSDRRLGCLPARP